MKYLKLLILVSVVVSLAVFLRATDFQKVLDAVGQVGSKFFILIVVTFLSSVLGTLSWRSCLGKEGKSVSLSQLFLIRHVGEIASIFNPAGIVGGEALKVHLLGSSPQLERKRVLASILVSRSIMIVTQLVLFTVVAFCLFIPGLQLIGLAEYSSYLVFLGLALIIICLLCFFRKDIKNWVIGTRWGSALWDKTLRLRTKLDGLLRSMSDLYHSDRGAMGWSSLYAALHWILGAMEFYLILIFLGIDVSLLQAILVDMGVIFFKTAGVFIPAQAGIEEYGNKIMLSVIGVKAAEIWITASVLRRARQLFWLAFGIGIYLCMYKTWTQRLQEFNGNIVR